MTNIIGLADLNSYLLGVVQNIEQQVDKITAEQKQRVDDMAEFAESQIYTDIMQAITPTGESGKPEGRIGPGRTVTGEFRDGRENRLVQNTKNAYVREVGWFNPKDYYVYQEFGFTHARSAKWIPGVRSIRDAADIIRSEFF